MGILFRKKKEKAPLKEPPKWFILLMVAFLLYAIADSLFTDRIEKVREGQRQAAQKSASTFMFTPLLPLEHGGRGVSVYLRDLVAGEGAGIGCWDIATLHYTLHRRDGSLVEDHSGAEDAPLRFTIGRGEVIPALERGVIGMKEGGRRQITARGSEAYGAPGFTHPQLTDQDEVALDVRLEKVETPENLPVSDLGLRIYSDGSGKGRSVQCLDRVAFKLRGWHTDGSPLWTPEQTERIYEAQIGRASIPYAIEKSLIGMQEKARRMLIVPPGYLRSISDYAQIGTAQETIQSDALQELPAPSWEGLTFPENQVILLEIEVQPLSDAASTPSHSPAQPAQE